LSENAWLYTAEIEVIEKIIKQVQIHQKILSKHVRVMKLIEKNILERKSPIVYQGGSPS
jgi:hypothetical protein